MNSENETGLGPDEKEFANEFGHGGGGGFGRGGRGGRFARGGRRKWLLKVPLIAAFIALVILLKSALFAYIWNLLIPELFHGPEITYLQAIGLMILAKLLVGFRGGGGFGRGGFGGGRFGGGFGHKQGWMMKEIWSRLPDEERQKLREDMRKRWNR